MSNNFCKISVIIIISRTVELSTYGAGPNGFNYCLFVLSSIWGVTLLESQQSLHTFVSAHFLDQLHPSHFITAIVCGRRPQSGAPWVSKSGKLSIREILVLMSVYICMPVRLYRLWGRGRRVPRQLIVGWRMPSFLGGKSRSAFGQQLVLAGNHMTTVAIEKADF